ncbi:MAG: acetyl-CoA C-acyltransferase [Hyphomicrobiales bacterium]|nr:acetyl-CoA C-acyltransferase [Hyphomicrobiales bacterium]
MTSNVNNSIVIASIARTPIGGFQGELSALPAPKIGAAAISSALSRASLKPEQISEVLMGCVLPAGQGQAPARQAAFGAGLPEAVPCTTVNKMCGSGMKTLMMAHDALHARPDDILVAGGMESMTNAPYLLPKARNGMRLGHSQALDHMFIDGLEDAYDTGRLMGTFAEDTAQHYQFTRTEQDNYAISSLERAKAANESGKFADEIAPITVQNRKSEKLVERDEQPFTAKPEKIPQLRPAFRPDGTVTAANSSSISDGAAALVMMTLGQAEKLGVKPLARICGVAAHAQAPAWFTTAPIEAIRKLQEKTGWRTADADLYEINEAFAVVAMAAIRDLSLPRNIVNINGGACALGHPIGASGARIVATLINALKQEGGRKGVAAICIGGGEATALAVELI